MRPERLLTPAYQMINTSRGGGGWQGQPNESSTQVSSQPEPPCRSGSSRRRRVTQSHGGTNTHTPLHHPHCALCPLCPCKVSLIISLLSYIHRTPLAAYLILILFTLSFPHLLPQSKRSSSFQIGHTAQHRYRRLKYQFKK